MLWIQEKDGKPACGIFEISYNLHGFKENTTTL